MSNVFGRRGKRSTERIGSLALSTIEQHFDAVTIARRLSVDPDTIRAEMTRGNLAYVRVGRKRVSPESVVVAYIAARAVGNHPARRIATRASSKD